MDPPSGNLTMEVINRNKQLQKSLTFLVKAVRNHRFQVDNGAYDPDTELYEKVEEVATSYPELFNV